MSRTKSKVNNHSHDLSVTVRLTSSGVPTNKPDQKRTVSLIDTCSYGDNIPGWKQLLSEGYGVVTDLQGVRWSMKAVPGVAEAVSSPDPFLASVTEVGYNGVNSMTPLAPSNLLDTTAERIAASKFLQSYIDATNTFRGGNFLAEIKDSVDLVLHPVRSLYQHTWEYAATVKKIGKVYAHKPKTAAAALSESWLAFSFGVKPFIQDANDASRALNELSMGNRHDIRLVKGFGSNSVVNSSTSLPWAGDSGYIPPIAFNHYTRSKSVNTVKYRAAIRAAPTGMGNLLNEFGVGVFDVVPAVWEGLPWSFFIDYFVNVGEMLDAMRLWNANPVWCIRTIRNSATTSHRFIPNMNRSPPPSFVALDTPGYFDITGTFVKRGASAIPYPSYRFKMPGTSPYRWLNITSLIGVINDSRWGSSKAPPLTLR